MLDSTSAWSAHLARKGEYVTMDLGHVGRIKGVITQKRKDKPWEYVKRFDVQYSSDGSHWHNIPGTFRGTSKWRGRFTGMFPEMVKGQYLKLLPKTWHAWISMRAGALLCNSRAIMDRLKVNTGMPTPKLGRCNEIIYNPDESHRAYSTVYLNDAPGTGHRQSMLDSPQAWSAGRAAVGEYMTMDMGEIAEVRGVITQNRKDKAYEMVRRFKVQYSIDGSTWQDIHQEFSFAREPYRNMIMRWRFKELVKARYVKLVVQSWNAWVSMRAGLFLCEAA